MPNDFFFPPHFCSQFNLSTCVLSYSISAKDSNYETVLTVTSAHKRLNNKTFSIHLIRFISRFTALVGLSWKMSPFCSFSHFSLLLAARINECPFRKLSRFRSDGPQRHQDGCWRRMKMKNGDIKCKVKFPHVCKHSRATSAVAL